jgi:hypothetical protein
MAAMSQKKPHQLVSLLETEAASHPWLYKDPRPWPALLGYAYMLLILLLSAGLPFSLSSDAVPLLALAAVIVRSL